MREIERGIGLESKSSDVEASRRLIGLRLRKTGAIGDHGMKRLSSCRKGPCGVGRGGKDVARGLGAPLKQNKNEK